MDVDRIEELIEVLESSQTEELTVRRGDVSVHIRRGRAPKRPSRQPAKPGELSAAQSEPQVEVAREKVVLAPMVGIFHAAGHSAVVGSHISEGQVVGAIESMKLLNDVVSGVSGSVVEVMVEDGAPVEYRAAFM